MLMAVTLSQATAAAWQDGQASAVIARVLQVAGAPTVQCPAAVRTEVPAPRRTGAASVPLAFEDPYVRESAHQDSTAMAAPSLVPSACTAGGPATTSVVSVSACQDSLEPCATKVALQHFLGRTVGTYASVRMETAVTTSLGNAPVEQASLAATVNRDVPLEPLDMGVSSYVSA